MDSLLNYEEIGRIEKGHFIIPKIATLELKCEIYESIVYASKSREMNPLNLHTILNKLSERQIKTNNNTIDYLFDFVIFDRMIYKDNYNNYTLQQEKQDAIKEYVENNRRKAKKAKNKAEKDKDEAEKDKAKIEMKLSKINTEIGKIEAIDFDKKELDKERKKAIDKIGKKERRIEDCEFYNHYISVITEEHWLNNNNVFCLKYADREKRKNAITKICILIIAFYISEDFEAFKKFVEKNKDLQEYI